MEKTLYLPLFYNLYREYNGTITKITSQTIKFGWVYCSGYFHDGEKFYMLPYEYFEPPLYPDYISLEDIDL